VKVALDNHRLVRNAGCETVLTLDRKAAKSATHRLLK
jgi:hypothetical protein